MLTQIAIEQIEQALNVKIKKQQSVSGGDIANSYKLISDSGFYFCKQMTGKVGKNVLMCEKEGLEMLSKTQTISIPEVYGIITVTSSTYLIMEYIETKRGNDSELYKLGTQLADLHLYYTNSDKEFGWHNDNFIGSLFQKNKYVDGWATFYAAFRLLPQIELAIKKGYFQASKRFATESITKKVESYMPQNVKVSLLHGDLWNGNYIISSAGVPYIIDPSIYFGHYEVDLAMSKLFGGFSSHFYKGHNTVIDYENDIESRIELYQLYYLLVHLNIFGSSYYNSCRAIIDRYF